VGRVHDDVGRLRALAGRTCILALALVAAIRIGPTTLDLIDGARAGAVPGAEHAIAGGRRAGVNTQFVEWVRRRIGPGERYWIATADAWRTPAVAQWLTFRLLPHEPVENARNADALIWYGDRARPRTPRGFSRVQWYRPGFGVALRDGS